MGREIRNVKPGWEHPKYTKDNAHRENLIGKYIPIFDQDYETAAEEWISGFRLWQEGKHPHQADYCKYFWEYEGTPDPDSYRAEKWAEGEATWVQMYETVSEGTPVTPAFATREELADYLVNHGTFWDSHGWSRKSADAFCKSGWAPSGIVTGGKLYTPETMGEIEG